MSHVTCVEKYQCIHRNTANHSKSLLPQEFTCDPCGNINGGEEKKVPRWGGARRLTERGFPKNRLRCRALFPRLKSKCSENKKKSRGPRHLMETEFPKTKTDWDIVQCASTTKKTCSKKKMEKKKVSRWGRALHLMEVVFPKDRLRCHALFSRLKKKCSHKKKMLTMRRGSTSNGSGVSQKQIEASCIFASTRVDCAVGGLAPVCVCVCVCIRMYVCVRSRRRVYTYTYLYVFIRIYTYTYVYKYIYVCRIKASRICASTCFDCAVGKLAPGRVCVCAYVHVCMCVCAIKASYIHIHAYMRIYTYIYIYRCIHICRIQWILNSTCMYKQVEARMHDVVHRYIHICRIQWRRASLLQSKLMERNPPPQGGFSFTIFPDQTRV